MAGTPLTVDPLSAVPRQSRARLLWLGLLAVALILALCISALVHLGPRGRQLASATAQAPQADGLVDRVGGYLVMDEPVGGIVAVRLPSGQRSYVRAPRSRPEGEPLAVTALAGPDVAGRVAYVEDDIVAKIHRLGVIRLDGTGSRTLFTRSDLWRPWGPVISKRIALSNQGGKVAFLSNLQPRQMRQPDGYLKEGPIEVWNVETGQSRRFDVAALDEEAIAWLPGGRTLLYTKLVPRENLPPLPLADDNFGAWYAQWPQIPAVHVLDTETGAERLLHIGGSPVVSPDGSFALVDGPVAEGSTAYRRVRIDSGESAPVTVPGGVPLAIVADDLYLCLGRPGAGIPIRKTTNNSPFVGPKPMVALNAAVPGTDRFQTLVPDIDPRRSVSFRCGSGPATSPATSNTN